MLFEKFDQVFAWDTTVLRTGDSVALKVSRIEPFADCAWLYFTDLGDLFSCECCHGFVCEIWKIGKFAYIK